MNFNISRNALSALFAQSAPKRGRTSVFAAILLLLLVFAGSAQAAGDAEFAAQARQVNDALHQLRQQAQGVPEAMRYVHMAEKLWKQAQAQWAMQQRHQQQNTMNEAQKKLLAQQKELMKQLMKQQQFLQQQPASSKRPELKTIDPFADYRAHGVSLRPEDGRLHNAKEGAGMEAWKEAMRQLESISGASSSSSTPTAAQSKEAKINCGSYDNPLPTVQILGKGAPGLNAEDSQREALLEETEGNKYAKMSPNELRNLSEKYPNNLEMQKAINALIASQKTYKNLSDLSEDAEINEYWSNREIGEGNKAAVHAAATATEVATGVPAGITEKVVAKDLEGAKEEARNYVKDKIKDELAPEIPIVDPIRDIYDTEKKVLIEIPESVINAVDHYDSASESYGYTRATGGYFPALTKAEKARQDMLLRSQKLHDLIEAQNQRKSSQQE